MVISAAAGLVNRPMTTRTAQIDSENAAINPKNVWKYSIPNGISPVRPK
ncbi:uncharacterized protein METZ01_LOCUS501080, partial [marine metagenome]